MLTFVVGPSGRGKSTLADRLGRCGERPVIHAGAWVREVCGEDRHGPEVALRLGEESRRLLASNPRRALDWIGSRLPGDHDAVIEGVRNPLDLLGLIKPGDHVIDVGGLGSPGWEAEGLAVIRASRPWLALHGVTWCDYKRHFGFFPEPVKASVRSAFLFSDARPGLTPGMIRALESYEGEKVTAYWESLGESGQFHDVPLEELLLADAACDPLPFNHAYGVAGRGAPVIEAGPGRCVVTIFNPGGEAAGLGASTGWIIHWPEDNLLLHFIADQQGRLMLWPPHKLLWSDSAQELPDWKKKR